MGNVDLFLDRVWGVTVVGVLLTYVQQVSFGPKHPLFPPPLKQIKMDTFSMSENFFLLAPSFAYSSRDVINLTGQDQFLKSDFALYRYSYLLTSPQLLETHSEKMQVLSSQKCDQFGISCVRTCISGVKRSCLTLLTVFAVFCG